jgi:EAL domain-containing protein (putative c-di-GMP-specific phosphodiesterase class I)
MSELIPAIDSGQLSLRYQPQVDVATGRVVAVEALVRWDHPERGPLGPDRFVPIAERSGMIHRLTEHVLAGAIAQAREWLDAGHVLDVSVNISTRDLLEEHMPARLGRMLADAGLPPERLVLEVTESGLMTDQERAVATIAHLRALGIGVSIDDYGTGYSSIAYLRRLAPTELKIDRSFVATMDADPDASAIVRATIDLAHVLGLTVVAEGVEDRSTWSALVDLGVDRVQGYAVARPLAAGAVAPLLDGARPIAAAV